MDVPCKLGLERLMNHPMPLDTALPFERGGHDMNTEMAFPAGAMAGMAFMLVRLIQNFQAVGLESLSQSFSDQIRAFHGSR